MAYATNTTVPIDKTRAEIESTLRRYGADQFSYGTDDSRGLAVVRFRAHDRTVQFVLYLPNRSDFNKTPTGLDRSAAQSLRLWEQACRSRWRALLLCIKAKLEAIEAGISEFEDEFLAHIVLPDGRTASEWLRPQIAIAYKTRRMPTDLLARPSPQPAD